MKPERMTDRTSAAAVLKRTTYGVLSLSRDDTPYGIPMNHCYDEGKDVLYFHGAFEGKKAALIQANPKASYVAVENPVIVPERLTTHYDTALATGEIYPVTDENEKAYALQALCRALCPGNEKAASMPFHTAARSVAIWKMTLTGLEGKRNR